MAYRKTSTIVKSEETLVSGFFKRRPSLQQASNPGYIE